VSGRMGCSNRGTDGYGCGYCRRLFRGITTRATNNKSRQNTFEDSESNFLPFRLKTKRQLPHVAPRATYPPGWSCPDWYIPRLGVYYMVAVMIDLKSGVTDCRRRARENSPIRGGITPPLLDFEVVVLNLQRPTLDRLPGSHHITRRADVRLVACTPGHSIPQAGGRRPASTRFSQLGGT